MDQLGKRSPGTKFDTFLRQPFKLVETVLQPENVTEAFENTVNPTLEHILNNLRESLAITAKRDAFPPKLVSGKMRVNSWNQENEAIGKHQ